MVQNTYGTKWFLVMVRNGNGTKWLWYEMTSFGKKLIVFQLTQEIMKMLIHLVSIHFTINWHKWIKLINSYVNLRIFKKFPAGYITLI